MPGRAIVAVAAVAATVSCGRAGPTGRPAEVVAAAPDRTVAAGAARLSVEVTAGRATGTVDLASGSLRLEVERFGSGRHEVLMVGDRAWQRRPGQAWEEVDTASLGPLDVPGLPAADARAAVALVRGARHVEVFGGLQVKQASTIRYDVEADPEAAAGAATGPAETRLRRLAGDGEGAVHLYVYVDTEGRIRRLEVPENPTSSTVLTRPDGHRVTTTIDFEQFGVPAEDLAPPA